VSFVARKSSECDSSVHGQRRHDRIASHSQPHVDDSCRKTSDNSGKYRVILDADDEDDYADQCEVQSWCLLYLLVMFVVLLLRY